MTAHLLGSFLAMCFLASAQQTKLPNGQKINGKPAGLCDGREKITPGDNIDYGVRFPQGNACAAAGSLYNGAGYLADAKQYWRKGCELGSPDGCTDLARQLVNEGNRQQAIALLENSSFGCATAPYAGVRLGDEGYHCDLALHDLVKGTLEETNVDSRLCTSGSAFGSGYCTDLVPMPQPPTSQSTAQWSQAVDRLHEVWQQANNLNEQRQDGEMKALNDAYEQFLRGGRPTMAQTLAAALAQRSTIQDTANAK
jgi:hypothetical protein